MKRRDFLKLLLATAAAEYVDYEKLLWIPGEKKIFIPESIDATLFGIPYHQTNASMGTWLGISRTEAYKEIVKLVQIMEKAKENQPVKVAPQSLK